MLSGLDRHMLAEILPPDVQRLVLSTPLTFALVAAP